MKTETLVVPALEEVLLLADQLGLPRPVGNRAVFDVWFLALHELGHYATKPLWYRNYARLLEWDHSLTDKPCAPPIPDLQMLADPTPNEAHTRLWAIQICEHMGWMNPVEANPTGFGGSSYNPRQWYVADREKLNSEMLAFGIDVFDGKLISQQTNVNLPYPNGTDLDELLANHDYIYSHFGVPCNSRDYSPAHLAFLKFFCSQIRK